VRVHRTLTSGLSLFFLTAGVLRAQQTREIVTDRPDVTEASTVVPRDSLQIENGFTQSNDHATGTFDFPESLARYGLTDRTELRVGIPNMFVGDGGSATVSGLSDLSIGIKQQIGPLPGKFDLAVIAALSFPTGGQRESSHGFDPFIKFPWSRPLTEHWSCGGMFSGFWETVDYRHHFLWEPTFYLERELTKNSDAFVEYAGDYFSHGSTREFIHLGGAYRIGPRNQIDFHVGFGLTRGTPNYFWAGGYSFRIDGLFHRRVT
jgi:outer membrane putative beta-barrel porin/alpha-amylase